MITDYSKILFTKESVDYFNKSVISNPIEKKGYMLNDLHRDLYFIIVNEDYSESFAKELNLPESFCKIFRKFNVLPISFSEMKYYVDYLETEIYPKWVVFNKKRNIEKEIDLIKQEFV